MKLKTHGMQDLTSTIVAVESLIKFKKESSKGRSKKTGGSGKGGGDRDKFPRRDKPSKDKGKGKKNDAPRNYSCFLCSGAH